MNYDLQEIKGRSYNFNIKDLTKVERNQLIYDIKHAMSVSPVNHIHKYSEFELTRNSGSMVFDEEILKKFHGDPNSILYISNDSLYFEALDIFISFSREPEIRYSPLSALKIQNNILELILFETDLPRIVYSSYFNSELISLSEIESIFIEIYENGLKKSIKSYNEE